MLERIARRLEAQLGKLIGEGLAEGHLSVTPRIRGRDGTRTRTGTRWRRRRGTAVPSPSRAVTAYVHRAKGSRARRRSRPPSRSRALGDGDARRRRDRVRLTARELLSTDFYLRKWGPRRHAASLGGRRLRVRPSTTDSAPRLEFLYSRYFRGQATTRIDLVPARGRCLLVTQISGTLPLDGVMIKRPGGGSRHPAPRDVQLADGDFIRAHAVAPAPR